MLRLILWVVAANCLLLLSPIVTSFSATSWQTRYVRSHPSALGAVSFTEPGKTRIQSSQMKIIDASNELLRLLQQKASSKTNDELDNQINSLVRTLIASKSTFDPRESLDGPLFATIHFIGDTPLWEKIAVGSVRNVKGQRYTLNDDTSGEFINYAEIWGQNLYLKAGGKFIEKGVVTSSAVSDIAMKTSNNPLDKLKSFFAIQENKQKKPTPYDYEAIVSGASIVLFGRYSFDVTIEGTGTVRVLYADPNLRIFLSPTDTDVTRGAGDWENAGLIVVQVRVDLVYNDWIDQTLQMQG